MQTIRIETEYDRWIEENVPNAFAAVGVKITKPTLAMLAHMLQSQREDGLVTEDKQLFKKAGELLSAATKTYVRMYGDEPMTVNRALHLVVNINRLAKVFPWGTSD
jgi:hypothetical protein